MVDMRVRNKDCGDLLGMKGEMRIALARLFATALV
jgi:hypothetical protein